MIKYFYLTPRLDLNRLYNSRSERNLGKQQWRSTPHTLKLEGWSPAIRWFNVISRTLVESLTSQPRRSWHIQQPQLMMVKEQQTCSSWLDFANKD